MDFIVIFEQGPTSVGAYIPDLPGCVAVGATHEEAHRLIIEAIQMHLAGMEEDDEPLPMPRLKRLFSEPSIFEEGSVHAKSSPADAPDDIPVTRGSGNVFLDLGFDAAEAALLQMRGSLLVLLYRHLQRLQVREGAMKDATGLYRTTDLNHATGGRLYRD